jgi:hypothetical protein
MKGWWMLTAGDGELSPAGASTSGAAAGDGDGSESDMGREGG